MTRASSTEARTSGRTWSIRAGCSAASLILVLTPALGSWSQSESLDSVDVGESRSLDDVPEATAGTPDGSRLSNSLPLDDVPAATAESPDAVPNTMGTPLDDAPLAESGAPNNDNLVWQPTPCSQMPTPAIEAPAAGDVGAWQAALQRANQHVDVTQDELQQATEAFGASLYRGEHLTAVRVRLGTARDAARVRYSEARCALRGTLVAARRAGIEPGVIRPYEKDGITEW